MRSRHRVHVGDARSMDAVDDESVELVVTSPPYPMIEMWDDVFGELDSAITERLREGDGQAAFRLMHETLVPVWEEVARVLVDGGIACINVGDATRSMDGNFRVYQNHARVIDAFERVGFQPLPDILWRKPANSAAKFMGSGMLPPNAYATLEHEYILLFRKGEDRRTFEPGADRRYRAAYFWEERNEWFSDVWTDIRGTYQAMDDHALRDRSGAYPFEIPYRLINMYSVYGDTVLDPFWGTGTTTVAAMVAGRDSIGYELQNEFTAVFEERVSDVARLSETVVKERLRRHDAFVRAQSASGGSLAYTAENYDVPVRTKQERAIQFHTVDALEKVDEGYVVTHTVYEDGGEEEPSTDVEQSAFGSEF